MNTTTYIGYAISVQFIDLMAGYKVYQKRKIGNINANIGICWIYKNICIKCRLIFYNINGKIISNSRVAFESKDNQ